MEVGVGVGVEVAVAVGVKVAVGVRLGFTSMPSGMGAAELRAEAIQPGSTAQANTAMAPTKDNASKVMSTDRQPCFFF